MTGLKENEFRGRIWFHKLRPVFEALHQKGIPYAVIKGEALSWYMYQTVGKRVSNDVDILVDKANLNALDQILTEHGFQQYVSEGKIANRTELISCILCSHQTISYKKLIEPYKLWLEVDVNFSLFWGEYKGKQINVADVLDHAEYIDIYGESVRTLEAPYAFVQVILHHYKDCNSLFLLATRNSLNEQMFREIYVFWLRYKNVITIQWLTEYAMKNQIAEYLFYMLYYTNKIFQDPMLATYVDALRTEEGMRFLNCYGLDGEKKKWTVSFEERLLAVSTGELIEAQLSEKDRGKIKYNQMLF